MTSYLRLVARWRRTGISTLLLVYEKWFLRETYNEIFVTHTYTIIIRTRAFYCCVKFSVLCAIIQILTTVLVIRVWTVLSVVHLVVDSRAIRVHSTSQVPDASLVRGLFIHLSAYFRRSSCLPCSIGLHCLPYCRNILTSILHVRTVRYCRAWDEMFRKIV